MRSTASAVIAPTSASIICEGSTVAPAQSVTCRGEYTIVQADVDVGRITNVATVTGATPGGGSVTDGDSETIEWQLSPQFELTKLEPQGTLTVGETLLWRFIVRNSGDVTLTNLVINDALTTPVTCALDVLSPGATTECTAESVLSQADVDAGEVVNTALATATDPTGTIYASEDTVVVPIPSPRAIRIDKASIADLVGVGDVINYTFEITNDGNVTLSSVVVTDPMADVSCPAMVLAVGSSMTCTASVIVTVELAGQSEIVNTATVVANDPQGNRLEASDTETTRTAGAPAVTPTPTPTQVLGPNPTATPGTTILTPPTSSILEGPGPAAPPAPTPPALVTQPTPDPLAHTGDTSARGITAGFTMLAAGGAIVVWGRRRRTSRRSAGHQTPANR